MLGIFHLRPLPVLATSMATTAVMVSSQLGFAPIDPASAADVLPIAFTGHLPPGVGASDIVVSLQPSASASRGLRNGQSMALAPLARSSVSVSKNQYIVRLDPDAVAPRFRDPGGVVTFDVVIVVDGGRRTATTTTSARTVGSRWADAEETTAPQDRRVAHLPRAVADPVKFDVSTLKNRRLAPVNAGNCVGPRPRKTQKAVQRRWSTLGTTYPVGRSTAWMEVSSSQGATYGFAASLTGRLGTWGVAGSRKITGGWGKSWNAAKGSRSYRKQVEYRKYFYEYLDARCNRYKWEPIVETGGTDSEPGIPRPDFRNCVAEDPGPWWRDRSDGAAYSFSAAVKLAELIGIDLSIEREYSKEQKLTYNLVGEHVLCGNNTYPARASKVMERYHR